MKITAKTSIEDLGALVCQKLNEVGIEAFLSGGAVVSIYSNNKYESYDLDFVTFGDRKKIKSVMESLGFTQEKSRHFIHSKTKYFVEFPGASVMIGDQKIIDFKEIRRGENVLRLLTPTDCIKDRLASYIHWNDKQAMEQAVLVARAQTFKLKSIQEFCAAEAGASAFNDFKTALKNS